MLKKPARPTVDQSLPGASLGVNTHSILFDTDRGPNIQAARLLFIVHANNLRQHPAYGLLDKAALLIQSPQPPPERMQRVNCDDYGGLLRLLGGLVAHLITFLPALSRR